MSEPLFRFSDARRRHPEVEAFFAVVADPMRVMAEPWFERLRAAGSDIREVMHDGNPTACVEDAAFAYVGAYRNHVSMGFYQGVDLPDPAGLLEGGGRRMRHLKLRPGLSIDEAALDGLIKAAHADMLRRIDRR
ncbi:MAG: DUF1801 domain-containing protein [Alphaproteobacteria bacterium]|nr:DUF1801 domain-containing protein [Alphaproteobacteria bacterium]